MKKNEPRSNPKLKAYHTRTQARQWVEEMTIAAFFPPSPLVLGRCG